MVRRRPLLLAAVAAGLVLASAASLLRETAPRPRSRQVSASNAATLPRAAAPVASAQSPAPVPAGAALPPAAPLRLVTGREILFGMAGGPPAAPRPGALGDVCRALLAEHRTAMGLDAVPGDLVVSREFDSLSGHHLRFRQTVGGVPVEGSEVSVHVAKDGRPLLLRADVFPVDGAASAPVVASEEAAAFALAAIADEDADEEGASSATSAEESKPPLLVLLPDGHGAHLAWRVDVRVPEQSTRVWIDAVDGGVLAARDLRLAAEGRAQIFDPNPVFSARDGRLRDRHDGDTAALTAQLKEVTLARLDGTGDLRGDWVDATKTRGHQRSVTLVWDGVTRADDLFEALMAYYHLDRTQQALQDLGITNANASRQTANGHALSGDQSYYDRADDTLRFGDGGVDDAEDADIVCHEYGHAVQDDQVDDFGSSTEGASMGEGFSDILAVSMRTPVGDPAWDGAFGSWDATSYDTGRIPVLRRVDRSKVYPRDLAGEVHADGEIWSRFLSDLSVLVGRDDMLRLVVESHFLLASFSRFQEGANAILVTNLSLRGGDDDAEIRALLRARGLPFSTPSQPPPPEDAFDAGAGNDAEETAAPLAAGDHRDLLLADDDWYSVTVDPYRRLRVTATFDPTRMDLELSVASAGAVRGLSDGASGTETVEVTTAAAPETFLVRAYHNRATAQVAGGYRLVVLDLDLETLAPGVAEIRRVTETGTFAGRLLVPQDKVGSRIVVTASAKGAHGAVNDIRIVSPDGVVADFGDGRRKGGARVVVQTSVAGTWIVEVRPRKGDGRYALKARFAN